MTHSDQDETRADRARVARVQRFIESLMDDGLSLEAVVELFHRGLAAKRYEREQKGGTSDG